MVRWVIMVMASFWIMFWNVENLFDTHDDPFTLDDEFTPMGERRWTRRRLDQKCAGIAKTVISVADLAGEPPALVGLAEIENAFILRKLTLSTYLRPFDYAFEHRDSPDRRGIDVALLYRRDLFRPVEVKPLRVPLPDSAATRDILYVKGLVARDSASSDEGETFYWDRSARFDGGDTLHVFVVHFPSKRGGTEQSDSRRQAAAEVLRCAADSICAAVYDARLVVMGDFNDTPENIVPLLPDFVNCASGVEPGTIRYMGRWETIDQFLLSGVEGRQTVYSPQFLLERDTRYLGWKPRRTYIGPRFNGGLSDHLPILVNLLLK